MIRVASLLLQSFASLLPPASALTLSTSVLFIIKGAILRHYSYFFIFFLINIQILPFTHNFITHNVSPFRLNARTLCTLAVVRRYQFFFPFPSTKIISQYGLPLPETHPFTQKPIELPRVVHTQN